MKTLLAIRHAKSSWSSGQSSDHDRPLNDRGYLDAPVMGRHLKSIGISPDVLLSSTANRALTTAKILAEELAFPTEEIIQKRDLYLAPSGVWLNAVQQLDEETETALIFGHNPGMHEFACRIVNSGGFESYPTLAVAHFELDAEYWGEVDWDSANLVNFFFPKGLNPQGD